MASRTLIAGRSAALAGTLAVLLLALSSEAEENRVLHKPAVNLSEVDNAESTLTLARVKDREGAQLGQVHGITRGVDGEIKTVQVALDQSPENVGKGSENVVALSARDMVYLREPNVIMASVTRAEAEALPRLER